MKIYRQTMILWLMHKIFPAQRPKFCVPLLILLCMTSITLPVLAASENPDETISRCTDLAFDASEMAYKAEYHCNFSQANQGLNLVKEATYLLSKVSILANQRMNSLMAVSVYNACIHVEAAISSVVSACEHIASQSPNVDVVHDANALLVPCELINKTNKVSMEIALATISGISKNAEAYSKIR